MIKYMKYVVMGVVAILALSVIVGSWYTVGETERGVILRNGAFVGVADPGLGFKLPFFDSVVSVDVTTQNMRYKNVLAYSRDQQPASMSVSVTYSAPSGQVGDLYKQYGNIENMRSRLIDRQVSTQLEGVFGQYTAVDAVQKRGQLGADYTNALRNVVSGPVSIISVQIENIDFDDVYEKKIQERMSAEVAVITEKQNLEKEKVLAEIQVTQAQATADSTLAKAEAAAKATRLQGEAEAAAIRAKATALAENGKLVELTKAERWDGKLPSTMYGDVVPFVQVK